ncbi:MAG: signal peptide peptidase SppA [Myxococcota bacterium]|nr:signal peptide peptidase SppA [Myxococcota bacterium]
MRTLFALVANLVRLPFFPLWWLARTLARPRPRWIALTIRDRVVEIAPPRAFWMRFVPGLETRVPTSLRALRLLADHVEKDPRLEGVVVTLPALAMPWARAQSLRDVLVRFRAAGKRVVVHLPDGGGHVTLFVASAASEILLAPGATLSTLGLAAEVRHVRDALAKIGVEVEPFTCGEYKTALERFTHASMSDAQREQLEVLLRGHERALANALAERGLVGEAFDAIFELGLHRGRAAIDAKLVDGLAHADEVRLALAPKPPLRSRAPEATSADAPTSKPPPPPMPAGAYLGYHEARFFRRLRRAPHVALVSIEGTILPGPKSARWIAALREARRDPRVRGVVLRVDSPGGSALTSEQLHREVLRLREKKPVVACFDGVAASGGYYLATHAHAIVAQPTTITGSIGVVSARLLARELLGRVGVRTEVVRTRAHADMSSPARTLDDAERAILRRELDATYALFVERVAEGRGMAPENVLTLAGGRVWSGADAADRGLVDRLGGLPAAHAEVLSRLPPHERTLPLEPLRPPRGDVPPAEPPAVVEAFVGGGRALLAQLAPELEAVALSSGAERALLWAPELPTID